MYEKILIWNFKKWDGEKYCIDVVQEKDR
jgi:hypothetical protein